MNNPDRTISPSCALDHPHVESVPKGSVVASPVAGSGGRLTALSGVAITTGACTKDELHDSESAGNQVNEEARADRETQVDEQTQVEVEPEPDRSASFEPAGTGASNVRLYYPESATLAQASMFLGQASTGATYEQIQAIAQTSEMQLQTTQHASGIQRWLVDQLTKPRPFRVLDRVEETFVRYGGRDGGFLPVRTYGVESAVWEGLIAGEDTLRQRMGLALSEIFVINIVQLGAWKAFSAASFMDILLDHAFGNFRNLLEAVTLSPAMAVFLTYLNNARADFVPGSKPDENYAREIMQLFTIGLYELNIDGSLKLHNGQPIETYTQSDVSGLARVFTGYTTDGRLGFSESLDRSAAWKPLVQDPELYETGAKSFLTAQIPAGATAEESLRIALDCLFNHENVGPFIGKQLIQRLVTSNPSPAYVQAVAEAFNSDANGVRGNLAHVLLTILLHDEARRPSQSPTAGKLREPMLCFVQWARAFKAKPLEGTTTFENYPIGSLHGEFKLASQSPLRSPSVFNFFRPGFVPPGGTDLGGAGLTAPEFQITNEVSVMAYSRFIQKVMSGRGFGTGQDRNYAYINMKSDFLDWLPLADDPMALVDRLALVLAHNSISRETRNLIVTAVEDHEMQTEDYKLRRVITAATIMMTCPEYLVFQYKEA